MSSSKEVIAKGKFLSLVKSNGYEMVERINCSGVVVVIPVTDDRKLVLVEQFRPPLAKKCIELPAGLVSDTESAQGESMSDAAMRELEEETGYRATTLEEVDRWATSSGMSSETVTVFRAHGLKKVGAGGGEEDENITVHVVDLRDVKQWLSTMGRGGYMIDPKIYAALYLIGA